MIELYQPKLEDLWFKEEMLGDEGTMSYNHFYGGRIPFPREKWGTWYDKWIVNHQDKRFYRYIKENGVFLGEVAYHFDDERRMYLVDVIVHQTYRGKGYGKAALTLLCEVARAKGIRELYDEIAIDNPSVAFFQNCGFHEVLRTDKSILVKKELGEPL